MVKFIDLSNQLDLSKYELMTCNGTTYLINT